MQLVRPLLAVHRRDTAAFCAARGLPICEDPTNASPLHARRNRVRLELLPMLEQHLAAGSASDRADISIEPSSSPGAAVVGSVASSLQRRRAQLHLATVVLRHKAADLLQRAHVPVADAEQELQAAGGSLAAGTVMAALNRWDTDGAASCCQSKCHAALTQLPALLTA